MMMNSDAEDHNSIPKLPLLLSAPSMASPEHSGATTPPLHTSASVPFRWEEEPGKPRPCTDIIPFNNNNNNNNPTCDLPPKSLDLPPRLLFEAKLTKLLSPTSVLEGSPASSESFRSPPSFRMGGSFSDEKGRLGALVLNRGGSAGGKWFGSWRKKGLRVRREVSWGSYVFPSYADNSSKDCDDAGFTGGGSLKMKRSGSFSGVFQANSCVWTTITESLKQVALPWRMKKQKKGVKH